MNITPKYYLKDYKERIERFGEQCVDIFFFSDQIDQVERCLCIPLSKKLNADVYWYEYKNQAIVCVMRENVYDAVKFGKEIIIQNFDTITPEYIDGNKRSLIFDDYSIIATFVVDNIYGLTKWCHDIDNELIVKTNSEGKQCVLTKDPLEFTSRIQAAYKQKPIRFLINFDFCKI